MKRPAVQCDGLCPVFQGAMDVLSRPWTGLIIASLHDGPLRFSELGARIPQLGDRMLAARLKELEAQGVLVRCVEGGPPVRVSYELTRAGRGFHTVYGALQQWGTALQRQKRKVPTGKRVSARPRAAQ